MTSRAAAQGLGKMEQVSGTTDAMRKYEAGRFSNLHVLARSAITLWLGDDGRRKDAARVWSAHWVLDILARQALVG